MAERETINGMTIEEIWRQWRAALERIRQLQAELDATPVGPTPTLEDRTMSGADA